MADVVEIEIKVSSQKAAADLGKVTTGLKSLAEGAGKAEAIISTGLNPSLSGLASLSAAGGPVTLALAAAVAVLAAGVFALGVSIKEAAQAELVQAQTAAVIRSTGEAAGFSAEQISDMAMELSNLSGVSDETIQSAENLLLTFTEIKGKVFPQAAQAALDLSTTFGMNLSSASIMLGKALQDPVQGLTALRRVGVSFSEAQAQMITRMAEHGRVAQAQALILREVNRQVAGSSEAMGNTTIGEWNKIKNIVGNTAEAVGGIFLPFINTALGNLRIIMSGLFRGIEPGLKAFQTAFKDLNKVLQSREGRKNLEELSEKLGSVFGTGMVGAIEIITDGVKGFANLWSKHGPEIVETVTEIGEALATVAGFINDLKTGMGILGQIGGLAAMNIPGFAGGVTNFGGGMAVVGERGPETMILPRGTSILPDGGAAAMSAQGGGGMTIHTLNVYPPNNASLAQILREARALRGVTG
jgi:hypothetical protein